MKFFGRSGKIEEEQEDKTVLFVCVENSGSQMAEAFFREYASKGYSAFSAGTDPKGKPIEKVREIRDNIEQRVRQLAEDHVKDNPKINN